MELQGMKVRRKPCSQMITIYCLYGNITRRCPTCIARFSTLCDLYHNYLDWVNYGHNARIVASQSETDSLPSNVRVALNPNLNVDFEI